MLHGAALLPLRLPLLLPLHLPLLLPPLLPLLLLPLLLPFLLPPLLRPLLLINDVEAWCYVAGALMIASAHDSIPDDLLLHSSSIEPNTPISPIPTPTSQTPSQAPSPEGSQHPLQGQQQSDGDLPERPDLTRVGSRHWEMGPHGISRLSSGHNLSRLSPGHRLSRLSPLRSEC